MLFEHYCELPTPHGIFRMYDTGNELMRVVTFGDINKLGPQPLFRLHSSCLASEVFEAQDCDCADQLREAMKLIAHDGSGVIVYMHQEGRGQGLSNKIQAVAKMQNSSIDTAEAFQALGLDQDIRDYEMAVDMLKKLSVDHVRLISNNPRKVSALAQAGLKVDIVNTHPRVRPENASYLKSKNIKLGHCLPLESKSINNSPILFYHSDQPWGELSNFSSHAVYLQDKIWRTTEHFYQAQKFILPTLQDEVRLASSPIKAKQIAKHLEINHCRPDWHSVKDSVMEQALTAKFSQHPELKALLTSTKGLNIAEHTSKDSYWGDAGDGSGLNRLGELLMQLRSTLSSSADSQTCVE